MIRLLFLFFLIMIPLTSRSADRQDDARELLSKMSKALHELDYRGLFTYEVGGGLDNYKIVHQVQDNIEYERLQKLNGDEKEILRSGSPQDCLNQGDRFFRGKANRFDDKSPTKSQPQSEYFFHLTGKGRIAGRDTQIVQVLPKDAYRYGYIFSIDEATQLPLQVLMIDQSKQILERIQYIDLAVGEAFDETDLLPRSKTFKTVENKKEHCDTKNQVLDNEEVLSNWDITWIPDGFYLGGSRKTRGGDTILSYSDGLSSFSIVIGINRLYPAAEGKAKIGGTIAYVKQLSWKQELFSITVVGEIPLVAARSIAEKIQHR